MVPCQSSCCRPASIHCKYIRCNFSTFFACPTFHCNPTVLFTSNCCSKYSGINVTLIYSGLLKHLHFYIVLCTANTYTVYAFSMCLTFHCNSTVLLTSNCCSKYSGINVKLIYCVWQTLFPYVPLSTVIPLYCLHLIAAPSTME